MTSFPSVTLPTPTFTHPVSRVSLGARVSRKSQARCALWVEGSEVGVGGGLYLLSPEHFPSTHRLPFGSCSSSGASRPHISLEVTKAVSASPWLQDRRHATIRTQPL